MNASIRLAPLALPALLVALLAAGCAGRRTVDNTPVDRFDPERYLGVWHEIARIDHWFERGMTRVSATCTRRGDGRLAILNTGLRDGRTIAKKAVARITPTPGLLRVSFFRPFYADYRILWIDDGYRHALVGGGTDDELWILARERTLAPDVRDTLLAEAKRRGYDVARLTWIAHDD